MRPVTIPKALAKNGDLVVIPRKEYEELLRLKRIREFQPTAEQKRALRKAEQSLASGKTISYDAAAKALGFAD